MYIPKLLVLAGLFFLSSCTSSFTRFVDGRSVTAVASFPNHVFENGSTPDEAAMTIRGTLFLVSADQIKWTRSTNQLDNPANWQTTPLPKFWKHLELKPNGSGISVIVDSQNLMTIG